MSPLTPLPTPVVFPFEPDGAFPVTEAISFVTNVLTSHQDNEQRIALRRRPAITLKYRLTGMARGEAGLLAGLLWKTIANRWYVPLWQHARRVTGVAAGVYSADMTDSRFTFSTLALVWKDSATWDLMTVSAIGAGSVTLAGATSFAHAAGVFVIPIGVGVLTPTYELNRSGVVSSGDVEFALDTTGVPNLGALAPAQSFKGAEVLNLHPDTVDGTEVERWVLSSERSGGTLGPFTNRAYGTSPVIARSKYWVLMTRAERTAFRQWLEARRGRKVPLWVPSYQDDVTLAVAAVINAGWIDIYSVNFANRYFGSTARVHLAILLPNRTVLPVTVTAVSIPSAGLERLSLEVPLTAAVPVNARVSLLSYARLSDDTVTLEHQTSEFSLVTTSFTELPRETPA